MKYCEKCKKIYSDRKKYCDLDNETELKPIPKDISNKCGDCGSDKVTYHDPDYILSDGYRIKGRNYCADCNHKRMIRTAELAVTKYAVVFTNGEEDISIFDDTYGAEEFIKDTVANSDYGEGEIDDCIVLEIIPADDITPEMFASGNSNMLLIESDWYIVKSANHPHLDYNGETSVSI